MGTDEGGWFGGGAKADGGDLKQAPRRRRRRMMDDEEDEESSHPQPSKAQEGWGASTSESKKEAAGGGDDDGDEILIIPDLEEEAEEDITTQVAQAPRNLTRRLPGLRELDAELKFAIPSGLGVDLSVLTTTLVPPDMVSEDDTTWEFDALLQEVTQEFIAESERAAEMKAKIEKQRADKSAGAGGDAAGATGTGGRTRGAPVDSAVATLEKSKPQPKSYKSFEDDDDDAKAGGGGRSGGGGGGGKNDDDDDDDDD